MKKIRIGLLPRILVAILLGVLSGQVLSLQWVRIFATFNAVFGQFLGFMIPLIIVGLVAPAIADIGKSAGKLLVITVVIAYVDTVFSGLLAYGTGSWLFPDMIAGASEVTDVGKATAIEPYFTVSIPPILDVMAALVFAFMVGLGIAYGNCRTLKESFKEFKEIVSKTIIKAIIPLLPLYIFGIFLCMTYTGQAYRIMLVFVQIIIVIFVLHFFILIYQFCIAGALVKHNPFRLLWNMLPAYLTALGTASSAATIPVTLKCSLRNGVHEGIAGFVVPLCATIHMSGSAMKITACALTICLLHGMPHGFGVFLNFVMLLAIMMVAAPGVPGGAIMAALAPLASVLGFGATDQALMIALYIAMDSFGTACNVTGDGAIALVVDRYFKKTIA
ncbi:transporter, dicarboxylate/amino acid:cation Na+/H+ symporter family protein [Hoylesella oralis ATCC 33269]|uniref:Transporter, dicarboxylate/amino acid:cation Na+/H+ symporter family protein n=1 Tax=Hoylesella oralis ATCC 33269 TaxID=873533 RepID=E7RN34_9BACT|nr:dicarboxylate/amino acid:cation symporter [Hoylesella oralis]EFZ38165.1 transporter, dicarboxylate/amino acid:cation Na+/H+ symporter family protein [Hoylesella oralis ATCC 33269]EPH16521.1 hypothetical protein HMPREF1475_01635 [Hoylesella oralis HGA0225]SHF37191.1 Na+/H+-dicarboxylate symporter [Hoylesella oralis]